MQITWFGHSAFRIESGKHVVMLDPFLTGNPVFKGDTRKAWEGATHVLLTHGHDDHIGDTPTILKETNAQLVANPEICGFLGAKNANYGNTGGTVDCGGFTVSFTQAHHSSSSKMDGGIVYLGERVAECRSFERVRDPETKLWARVLAVAARRQPR